LHISTHAASSSIRPRFASRRIVPAAAPRGVASKLNEELELYWNALAIDRSKADLNRYDEARRRTRSLGFEYIENAQLRMLPRSSVSTASTPRWTINVHVRELQARLARSGLAIELMARARGTSRCARLKVPMALEECRSTI
jgi:hypothetical protein